jgi:hypothetical protein
MFSTRDLGASIVLRVVVYYAALVGLTWFLIRLAAPSGGMPEPLRELLGFAPVTLGDFSRGEILSRPPNVAGVRVQILTASVAMISAFMLALPVAWVYILTRAKRGFQQSVVQSLIILPIVVAGILVLVKHSLALAFGLGAVVAAVRFRSNLEDSKDAVYVFLSIGLGLAAGVQVPVALALSVIFNSVILLLWYTDFGRAPADLEGDVARRRLERAMATANRTGMFVALLDEEVLESLSPDQLDALADRAWRRKRRGSARKKSKDGPTQEFSTGETPAVSAPFDLLLRVHTKNPDAARTAVDGVMNEFFPRWRFGGVVHETDGTHWLEYGVGQPEKLPPQQVLYELRTRALPEVISVELV